MRIFFLVFFALLSSAPAFAQDTRAKIRLAVIDQMRVDSCAFVGRNFRAVATDLQVNFEDVQTAALDLMIAGLIVKPVGPTAFLHPVLCDTETADPRSLFIAMSRIYECSLTDAALADVSAYLGPATAARLPPAIAAMITGGEAVQTSFGLTIHRRQCLGPSEPLPAPAGQIAARLAGQNCQQTDTTSMAFLEAATDLQAPFSLLVAHRMLDTKLIQDPTGRLIVGGGTVVLDPILCARFAPARIAAPPLVADRAAVAAIVMGNACTLPEADLAARSPTYGLTPDRSAAALAVAITATEITRADGQLTLAPDLCSPSTPFIQRAAIIAALTSTGCAMPTPDADAVLTAYGLSKENTLPVFRLMQKAGEGSFDDTTLQLSPAVCTPP